MNKLDSIVLKTGTRILRPCEVTKLIETIPKIENRIKFEALLYTGCRYTELQWLYKHSKAFKSSYIQMPSFKHKAIYPERFIRLNPQGQHAVAYYLKSSKPLPHYVGWQKNLKEWCKKADIDTTGIGVKVSRKTWESWLVTIYTKNLEHIFLSQGHGKMTALNFYIMLPFTKQDIEDMHFYTDGWI